MPAAASFASESESVLIVSLLMERVFLVAVFFFMAFLLIRHQIQSSFYS